MKLTDWSQPLLAPLSRVCRAAFIVCVAAGAASGCSDEAGPVDGADVADTGASGDTTIDPDVQDPDVQDPDVQDPDVQDPDTDVQPECVDDEDCEGGTCEEQACVPHECVEDEDCDDVALACDANVCVPRTCDDDDDCPGGWCDDDELCVPYECLDDEDCERGACSYGFCEPYECVDDEECIDGTCVDNRCERPPGPCTLGLHVQSLGEAMSDSRCTRLDVPAGTFEVQGTSVFRSLEIRGAGSELTTLDAGGAGRHFNATINGRTLTLTGLTLTGGSATDGGSVNMAGEDSRLELDDVLFAGNRAGRAGGAVQLASATLDARSCAFVGNEVVNTGSGNLASGGAIAASSATILLDGCRFEGNVAATDLETASGGAARGGAVSMSGGSLLAEQTTFEGNRVEARGQAATERTGGAIFASSASVLLRHGTRLIGNTAAMPAGCASCGTARGGALDLDRGSLVLEDMTVASNRSENPIGNGITRGGGVYVDNADQVLVSGTTFEENEVRLGNTRSGGALYVIVNQLGRTTQLLVERTTFTDNSVSCDDVDCPVSATGAGGAATLHITLGTLDALFDRTLWHGNRTIAPGTNSGGGAVYITGFGNGVANIDFVNTTMSGNDSASGSAIRFAGSGNASSPPRVYTIRLFNTTIAANTGGTALRVQGSISLPDPQVVLEVRNTVMLDSGGFCSFNSSVDARSLGWRFSRGTSQCTFSAGTGDTVIENTDLDELSDNGGGTLTHAFVTGASAIGGGEPGGCTVAGSALTADQRGNARTTANCTPGAWSP